MWKPRRFTLITNFIFFFLGMFFMASCSRKAEESTRSGEPPLIPLEVLMGNPERVYPQISPDGTIMAYLAPVENVLNVWVATVGARDDRALTKAKDRGIQMYFWSEDSENIMYLQDAGGNENWRLYSANLRTGETRDLTPFENVQVQVVKVDKHHPDELLIAMNKEDQRAHDVYHLDIPSGELAMIVKNPGNVIEWLTDSEFRVRGAMASTPDGGFDLLVRDSEEAPWIAKVHWDHESGLSSGPVSFTMDGESIYLKDSRDSNASRLVVMNISTGAARVIAEDPKYDVNEVMIHPDTYEVQAVTFTKDREEWAILDDSIRQDFEKITALDYGDCWIYGRDNADDTWLVGFSPDNGPISYWIYDRGRKEGTFLFDHRPALNQYTLAQMEPISFASRDGLTIHGYITFPPGSGRTNLPMVLNVHGGPWYRDTWRFNTEVQWLANRGYICLQVNFRGSTGYGKDFLNAGDREWAGRMHDDLVDAVNWAVAKGYADPERIAIYGGSYGGYAALVGATFTPEVFCCAVDIVGPSNLITLVQTIPPYWTPYLELFHRRLGDPEKDEEFLKSRSPLFRVDQIQIPILIAQGANDPRVRQAESEQIVEAMKAKGIDYEYILFPDEGHGLTKPESRLTFYAAAEKFLAKHLGGRAGEKAE